jgi:hypothetical protein
LSRSSTRDYRQVLKRRGRPTLFHMALAWEYVAPQDFDAFSELVSENLTHLRAARPLPEAWFSFEIRRPLPPSAVLAHEHPDHILDPLQGHTTYVFAENAA